MDKKLWSRCKSFLTEKNNLLLLIIAGVAIMVLAIPTGKGKASKQSAGTGIGADAGSTGDLYIGADGNPITGNAGYTGAGIGTDVYPEATTAYREYVTALEQKTSEKLAEIKGTGEVSVMIVLSGTEERVITYDGRDPYLIKTDFPKVSGILVLADGAGNPVIARELMQAVEALFGIEANHISILPKQ